MDNEKMFIIVVYGDDDEFDVGGLADWSDATL